jgi:hypothetical protein
MMDLINATSIVHCARVAGLRAAACLVCELTTAAPAGEDRAADEGREKGRS